MNDRADEALLLDEAVFAPARLTRGGRPAPGLAIGLAIGSLALVGVLGSKGAAAAGEPGWSAATFLRPDVTTAAERAAAREAPWRSHPGTGEPFAAPLLAFEARLSGRRLFVNGDVFTRRADAVVVAVGDLDGTHEMRLLDMPGGSTAFRLGPNDRFEVAFELDHWTTEPAWVTATAYDRAGNALGSVRQSLVVDVGHDRLPGATGRA